MKKIKLILMAMTLFWGSFLVSGCNNNELQNNSQKTEDKSIAFVLTEQFKEEMKKEQNLEKVANSISKNEVLQTQIEVSTIKEGDYISGFQTEITGFDQAVVMRPMIGTIPFIAYIFEVQNTSEFAETLKENADLRWNICTEADDMEVAIVDHYVFFIMAPENFES